VKYVNEVKGFNSRLDPIQAAVLRAKLQVLDAWNERRNAIAQQYLEGLAGTGLVLPKVPEWAGPVWHLFVVRLAKRDALVKHLNEAEVSTLIHYPVPPHLQAAYADLGFAPNAFPLAARIAEEVVSLPIGPHLSSILIKSICKLIHE
jgi:dTDP-4-amino-4,6-dideoxygalactose transaminase